MNHLNHEEPLKWLVREKLHPASTLGDRVRALRKKRRKARITPAEEQAREAMFLSRATVETDDPMEPREPLVEEAP